MIVPNSLNLPWETIVGMGSYLVGDRYCNLDSDPVRTTTKVVCGTISDIKSALLSIYFFVKENISFGYPASMTLNAGQIMGLGYGDAVAKTVLFVTMCRIAKIPTRVHGYYADPNFLRGLEPIGFFGRPPKKILALVPEIFAGNRWVSLGGITLDTKYIERLNTIFQPNQPCYGYGLADERTFNVFTRTQGQWDMVSDTTCQSKAFIEDLGIHNSAQVLIDKYSATSSTYGWSHVTAPCITRSVSRIRGS